MTRNREVLLHRLKRELGQWWISVALGHHCAAVFLSGKRETWKTEEVGKGAVFGFHVGRLDYEQEGGDV